MKAPGYILSLYMLLLAVFPCCAFDDCPEDKTPVENIASHQDGDEDCGTCSPFFNCEGCASIPVTIEQAYIPVNAFFIQQVYTGFLSPSIPDVSYDFWQPPKIG